ncbi:hypothetical protein ACEQ8H_004124 [Pleosporales sp. CAS-2024a]
MAVPSNQVPKRLSIVPDGAHVQWHLAKEEFATDYLFDKVPYHKGAIAGQAVGNQVWALWTHGYYARPGAADTNNNVLYILRLVVEGDETATRIPSHAAKRPPKHVYDSLLQSLKAALDAAQAEAAEWKLHVVKLWDPTPLVVDMLGQISGLEYHIVEREQEEIASLM